MPFVIYFVLLLTICYKGHYLYSPSNQEVYFMSTPSWPVRNISTDIYLQLMVVIELHWWLYNTVHIWSLILSIFFRFKKRMVYKWSEFWLESEIWKPRPSFEIRPNGCHFIKNHLKFRQKKSRFWMVRFSKWWGPWLQPYLNLLKTGSFEIH